MGLGLCSVHLLIRSLKLRAVCGSSLVVLVASAAAPAAAPAAARPAITVRSGDQVIGKLTRPADAKIAASSSAVPEGMPGVPHRVALAWTTVQRVSKTHRAWRTYVTWCDVRCEPPLRLATSRRRSARGWRTEITVDDDRALVRFGVQTDAHWSLVQRRKGKLAKGRAAAWGNWSAFALARRADGTHWAASSTAAQVGYVRQLTDGATFGPSAATQVASPADSLDLHALGSGLAATWDAREVPEDEVGRIIWSAGAEPGDLANPANQVTIAASGARATLHGPAAGPLLLTWVDAEVRGAGVRSAARAGWVQAGGRPDPTMAANFGNRADADYLQGWLVNTVLFTDGSLALCPAQIVAPTLGGPLATGAQPACPDPWRIKW